MKKFILSALALFSIVPLITGCQKDKGQTIRFKEEKGSTIESPQNKGVKEGGVKEAAEKEGLSVTSFSGSTWETSKNVNILMGTAPQGTYKIKVNNYVLTKYKKGQKSWSYRVATHLNTLKPGENKYHVAALDQKGQVISELDFTITYNPPAVTTLPKVGNSLAFPVVLTLVLMYVWRIIKNFWQAKKPILVDR